MAGNGWSPQVARYVSNNPDHIRLGQTRWVASSISPDNVRWYWHGYGEYRSKLDYCTTRPSNFPVLDSYRFRFMAKWRALRIQEFVENNLSVYGKGQYGDWSSV